MSRQITSTILVLVVLSVSVTANAMIHLFSLNDHRDGNRVPPTYGLRIDDLIGEGDFAFSFNYRNISKRPADAGRFLFLS